MIDKLLMAIPMPLVLMGTKALRYFPAYTKPVWLILSSLLRLFLFTLTLKGFNVSQDFLTFLNFLQALMTSQRVSDFPPEFIIIIYD